MAVNEIPWEEVRRDYLRGATYQELAEKYGVAPSTVGRHRRQENWGNRSRSALFLAALTDQMMDAVDETLHRRSEPLNVRELKDLTALLRELLSLRDLTLTGDGGEDTLRVVLEGELERWGE